MIDFKYHLVSIVAVFLALAIGIVLGTNVLSGDVLQNLKTQTSDLRKEAQGLRDQIQQQQKQMADDENFAAAIEPVAIAGALSGRHVAIVTLPDASKGLRDHVAKTLAMAGATVTAQVGIDESYADPGRVATLQELLKTLGATTFDPAGDVSARAANTLAAALVGPALNRGSSDGSGGDGGRPGSPVPGSAPPVSPPPTTKSPTTTATSTKPASAISSSGVDSTPRPSAPQVAPTPPATPTASPGPTLPPGPRSISPDSAEVLAALGKAGFISTDDPPTLYADMVVVVSAATPAKASPSPSPSPLANLLDLVAALQRAGAQTVLVGPVGSAESGSLLAQLRANDSLQKAVSAVDDADTASGRIAMVFALSAQASGKVGQYGTGEGAGAPLPTTASLAATGAARS